MVAQAVVPLGFRFKPTDEEIITFLHCLEDGEELECGDEIIRADVYGEDEPWQLFQRYGKQGKKVVYFATTLKKKFIKSNNRVSRIVGRTDGTWVGQNKGTSIKDSSRTIMGWKKSLRYQNKRNSSETCQWLMTEYNLRQESKPLDLVICRIKNKRKDEEQHVPSTNFDDNNQNMFMVPQQEDPTVLTTINGAAVAPKPVLGMVDDDNTNDHNNNLNNEELNYSIYLDQLLDLDSTVGPTEKPQVDYNPYASELLQLPPKMITGAIEQDANANVNHYDHRNSTTVDHQHDNQPLIMDNNQGGGALSLPPILMPNWDDDIAEGMFEVDYFVEQLKQCGGDDLEQSTDNITMLPGPDLYTQNHLLW